jgi:oligopeptide/dipeptide ABC transporter ATP-binding protein
MAALVSPASAVEAPALQVRDLSVALRRRGGERATVVDRVSFAVARGESLGIVGESGSGKSLTLRAVMGLLPPVASVRSGAVALSGDEIGFTGRTARRSRRGRIAMVFQDALTALDPVHTVGSQVAEVGRFVKGQSRRQAWDRAVELLDLVGIRDPARRAHSFPHELSGGMRQRVMIAIALATEPAVMLCDEPTTALDVTVQAQVLELLDDLRRRLDVALVFVSHDLAVVRQVADRLAVMYTGRIVETGATAEVLRRPLHPYTRGLLAATVDIDDRARHATPIPGQIPEPGELPTGCSFHPRCAFATAECASTDVELHPVPTGSPTDEPQASACLHAEALLTP